MNRFEIALNKARAKRGSSKYVNQRYINFTSPDKEDVKESKKVFRQYCYDIKNDCLVDVPKINWL